MQSEESIATTKPCPTDSEHKDTDGRPGPSSTEYTARSSQTRSSSQSSLYSGSSSGPSASCVSRERLSADDCARQRFIVWAAVKRNRSVRMAASERLRCPLLRCGERFSEHEEMLRHLTQCGHLSTGEYVCYECMKVERFNDKGCRCCFEQPTKRRRIINMARTFFANIGTARARREDNRTFTRDSYLSQPPSIDALAVDIHQQHGHLEEALPPQDTTRPPLDQQELNGTELLELDSTPLKHSAELDATTIKPFKAKEVARPEVPPTLPKPCHPPARPQAVCPSQREASRGGSRRPSLALNTQVDSYRTKARSTYFSPTSSLRPPSHAISPITPWSASSKSSAIWSTASRPDKNMLASPITPLSATVYPAASQEATFPSTEESSCTTTCPKDPCQYMLGNGPDLSGDDHLPFAVPPLPSDPLLYPYGSEDDFSWISSLGTEMSTDISVNMMFADPNTKPGIPTDFLEKQVSNSETKALVEQVWDTLGAHFSESLSKLRGLRNNALAVNLRGQTPSTIALVGLTRLRQALSHSYDSQPDPYEYVCFIHLIYSISLVLFGTDFFTRSSKLYEQAIDYGGHLDATQRESYYQVVSTLWLQHPQPLMTDRRSREPKNREVGGKGKGKGPGHLHQAGVVSSLGNEPLEMIGQHFLDELEYTVISGDTQQPMGVLDSELWSCHASQTEPNSQGHMPLAIASTYLVEDLIRKYPGYENLARKLKTMAHNHRAGYHSTIRKLELQLIQAGKNIFTSDDFFDQYVPQVRGLCDSIYSQQGFRPRAEYYLHGISLVESLIRSLAPEPQQQHQGAIPGYPTGFPSLPYSFPVGDLALWGDFISNPSASSTNTDEVPNFGTPLDPTPFHPGAQMPTGTPAHMPLMSVAPKTSSLKYPVSPIAFDVPPDVPPDVPAPSLFKPTPPAPGRLERNDTPGPPALISSGSKVQASERCEICGYRPKGDPQWFKGSMAKHKKMQHSAHPPIIYKCPFPGCSSEYRNRRDNLRQHQIEKNHFVGDEFTHRPKKRRRDQI
ncbi:hypothetical protein F5Y17DRAFT_169985 [Xylariaceae sp. FL0594]|nr:hypothetical protein F5Y17DRAFT_169985 [Xylariaceae sp. FL0594]